MSQQPQDDARPVSAAGRASTQPAQAIVAAAGPASASEGEADGPSRRVRGQGASIRARLNDEDPPSFGFTTLQRLGERNLEAVNELTSRIDRLLAVLEANVAPERAAAPPPATAAASSAATERPADAEAPAPPTGPALADASAYPLAVDETPRYSTAARQQIGNEAASFARAYPPHLAPVQGTPPSPTLGRAYEPAAQRHRLPRPTVTPADYYRDRPDLRAHVAVPSQASDEAGDASTGTAAGHYRPPKVDFPKFDGTRSSLDAFLIQSEVWRSTQSIPSDRRMIEIVGLNLKGRAQEWWVSKIKADPDRVGAIFQNWETFKLRLKALYGNIDPGTEALSELMALRQSAMPKRSASEYVERFTALLLRSNLDNDEMAVTLFKTGLEPEFLKPFERSPPKTLPEWCHEVERLDREREDNRLLPGIATSTRQADPRVDKKLAEARALRNQRRAAGLCLGCGEAGHFLADCTKKESSKMVALLTVLEDLEASSDEEDAEDAEPSSASESDQGNESQDEH
ncbi:uncharacterized protein PSFLO_05772 [Pseudozyma flocculosa]|uniref:CCHC-type domain-containing protein n=1 Tax=Pseudozyma flocculosa TaxID=84751 RepID=A0A5C3F7W4_9BASI|nr:uncharacterized protein PSFLO_05772 [Pseudozyma flocculosa]